MIEIKAVWPHREGGGLGRRARSADVEQQVRLQSEQPAGEPMTHPVFFPPLQLARASSRDAFVKPEVPPEPQRHPQP